MPKKSKKFRYWETKKVRTTCSYCGVGCQMDLLVKDNKVVEVQPVDGLQTKDCLGKGKIWVSLHRSSGRLKTRSSKIWEFVEATWIGI